MSNSVCLLELARTLWGWIWMPTTRHIERELNEAPRYSTRILRVTCVPKELCEEVFETCHELNRSSRFRANSMRYSMQCGWHSYIAPESCVSNVYARSYVKKSSKLATNSMSHSVSCHLSIQGGVWLSLSYFARTQWVTVRPVVGIQIQPHWVRAKSRRHTEWLIEFAHSVSCGWHSDSAPESCLSPVYS